MFKKNTFILAVLVLTLISSMAWAGGNPFFDWLDQRIERQEYSTQNDVHHIRIAGLDMWIPYNYKLGSYDDNNLDQRSVLLQLLLPDFEPRTKDNIEKFTEGRGYGDRLQILLEDFSQSTDINFRYQKTFEMAAPYEAIENHYRFDEAFRSIYPDQVILGAEFYVKKDGKNIKTYITCNIGQRIKDQGCQQHLVYEGIFLQMSYSSRYLSDWEALEVKAINLIEQLKIKPLEGKPI